MTFEEALVELGLDADADADADAGRRAYLRLIKIRKPETDPEGFRRVREAYEIIRAGIGSAALGGGMRERTARAAPEAGPSSPDADADAARPHEPPGTSAPAAAPETAFLGFLKAWESVPPFADRTARVEIAREAVAALPAEPRAHWLLATSLSGMAPDSVLADALRAAHRLGHHGFLDALLTRTPRAARREEVDEAIRSDDSSLRLAGAMACAPWDPATAAAIAVQICGGASPQTRPGDEAAGEVDIPLGRALEVILILYAHGAVAQAATAERSLGAWIRARDLETTVARGPLGGVWLLTEEIARLPDDFPDALRRSLATATRAGDLTSAFHDACDFVRKNRRASRPLLARLGTATPNVAATLSSAIETERARRKSLGWFRVSFLPRMIIVPSRTRSAST